MLARFCFCLPAECAASSHHRPAFHWVLLVAPTAVPFSRCRATSRATGKERAISPTRSSVAYDSDVESAESGSSFTTQVGG